MHKTDKDIFSYSYKNISDLESKRVIIRSGLNVAVDGEGKVTDRTRLDESMQLISDLAGKVKRLVIMGHLGRPEAGKFEKKYSFWNLAELINQELKKINTDLEVKLVNELSGVTEDNRIYLIENIRFFEGEETKNKEKRHNFAEELSNLADVFINDAFADYRESASTYDIAIQLPSYLGPVFLKEVEALSYFNNPQKPFVAVLGGAKLSEKLDTLNSLAELADEIVVGGAMAYTLMKAKGIEVGKSLVEEDKIEVARKILNKYSDKLILPLDHMVSDSFDEDSDYSYTDSDIVPEAKVAIDIGPKTIKLISETLNDAQAILWNGPMGVFEWAHSAKGTLEIGRAMEANTEAFKLAGGGDSIVAINKLGLKGFDHISTGGGAMLAFLTYESFPTLDVIIGN